MIKIKNTYSGERFLFETHINDLLISKKDTKRSEALLVEVPKGKTTHLHVYEECEQIFVVLQGEGCILTEKKGERIAFKKGDIVYISPDQHRKVCNTSPFSLKYICVSSFTNTASKDKEIEYRKNQAIKKYESNKLELDHFSDAPFIVTGANGFIGRAIVKNLLEKGMPVWAWDKKFDDELFMDYNSHLILKSEVDLLDSDRIENLLLDINIYPRTLICAHHCNIKNKHTFETSFKEFQEGLMEELGTNFNVSKLYAMQAVNRQVEGSIVFLTSVGAEKAHREHPAYDSAKGGLNALCRALSLDLASQQINVNAIAIGPIESSPTSKEDGALSKQLIGLVPLQRYAKPEEIASFISAFAIENNRFVTGQVFTIDGGLSSQLRPLNIERIQNPSLFSTNLSHEHV